MAPNKQQTSAVQLAEKKRHAGLLTKLRDESLSAAELRELKLYEAPGEHLSVREQKQREEELRWAYYRSIPVRHYTEMAGRGRQVILRQADMYDLPLRGPHIDLPAVVRAFHDFLAENWRKLAPKETALREPLDRLRDEKARIAEIERRKLEADLVPRKTVDSEMAERISYVREGLLGMAKRLGPEVSGRPPLDATRIIERYVLALLRRFAGEGDEGDD
jgi:hypothetical protein